MCLVMSRYGLLLLPSEKVHVGKLLHLLHVHNLNNLFVVEEDPWVLVS